MAAVDAVSRQFQSVGSIVKPLVLSAGLSVAGTVRARKLSAKAYVGAHITDYDPLDPSTAAQPHDEYRKLHATGRVHYSPKRSTWILTRHADVRAALTDTDKLNSTHGVTRMRFSMPTLVMTDGEQHAQLRKKVQPAFTKRALDSWTDVIDGLAHDLVADVLNHPGCDVVQRLAIPMPITMIAYVLGIPAADVDKFRRWSESAIRILDFAPNREAAVRSAKAAASVISLRRYFMDKIAAGALKDRSSALGRLVEGNADGALTDDDLFHFALLLLIAGNETTTNLLGGLFDTLGRNPEQFEMIRARPELVSAAIEEQLRYSSPIQNLYRYTVADYPVGDAVIPTGSRVMLSFGAANRDPLAYDDPDNFRADRNPRTHMAFGYGAHMCLGAPLARLEAQAVLRELVDNVSKISPTRETVWSTNSSLRGPTSLHIRLSPA